MKDSESPRQRILDVALALFAESGYEGASLQQVADRVGLHKSSLFHHFRSKEDLAREVYRGLTERLLKRLEPFLAEDPPRLESLLVALEASADHFAAEPAAARLLMRLMVTTRPEAAPGAGHGDPFTTPIGQVDAIDRLLWGVGAWLARARAAGVIRHVPVRHTVLNLMGLVLFYPAVLHHIPPDRLAADPRAPELLASRKRELRGFLEAALAPT
ncbi:TetR/AcrR family transcriptional regulator [Myxococcota bacterium]|nr:TetR/AcrR family transcriptional regulator [Myxococcota bacterium]MCZ7618264.1 TetR/AcrR family transcriptional regulator [Myxococcota bacterium]